MQCTPELQLPASQRALRKLYRWQVDSFAFGSMLFVECSHSGATLACGCGLPMEHHLHHPILGARPLAWVVSSVEGRGAHASGITASSTSMVAMRASRSASLKRVLFSTADSNKCLIFGPMCSDLVRTLCPIKAQAFRRRRALVAEPVTVTAISLEQRS